MLARTASATIAVRVVAPKRVLRAATRSPATDADILTAILFAVGKPVRCADLLEASGWTAPRLQAAADLLKAEPPPPRLTRQMSRHTR